MGSRSIQFFFVLALSSLLILANAKKDLLAGHCDRFPTAKQECRTLHEIVTHPEMLAKDPQVFSRTMLKFAIAYGGDVKAHIRLLLKKYSDEVVRTSLQSCSDLYHEATLKLKETLSGLKSKRVNPSYYVNANQEISGAMDYARNCVDGWKAKAQPIKALPKMEKTFVQACKFALDSVNQLPEAKSAAAPAVAPSPKN